jgi:hypothetical protein
MALRRTIEGLDAVEIRLNQSPGCGAALGHRFFLVRDRRFAYFEGLRVNALSAGDRKRAKEKTGAGFHLENLTIGICCD